MKEDKNRYKSGCPEAGGQKKAISDRAWKTLKQSVQKNNMTQETSVNDQVVINCAVLSKKKQT